MNAALELTVHHCSNGTTYQVAFTGPTADATAAEFVTRKRSTSTVRFADTMGDVSPIHFPLTDAAMNPLCEHGMTLQNCYGPDHYMSAAQEMAMGWEYAD